MTRPVPAPTVVPTPASAPPPPGRGGGVVVVATTGTGSMSRYGRQLAAAVGGPAAVVDPARSSAGRFGTRLASPAAARELVGDVALLRRLRALPGVPHLTHHHLARYGPLLGRPYLVTAHDLIRRADLLGTAEHIAPLRARDRAGLRLDHRGFARAAHLVAPSEATRRELVADLGVDPDRVTVVPEGVDHGVFRPVARRLHPGRYLLSVGSDHPRKDLPTLLRAFARLAADDPDLLLVKVGEPGDGEAPFGERTRAEIAALGLGRRVLLTGAVGRDDLVAWYAGATALVMPSRAEGFGLPPLEAMACGAPVVVSSAGALPEVVGDAGLVVPPGDPDALAAALRRLLADPALAASLRGRGLARAAGFTWERAGALTRAVHAAVLDRLAATSGRCA